MRIALVMDDMPVRSNGTSSTALRYADALREQGHEVICVAFGADDPDSFDVPEHHIPVVTPVAEGSISTSRCLTRRSSMKHSPMLTSSISSSPSP